MMMQIAECRLWKILSSQLWIMNFERLTGD